MCISVQKIIILIFPTVCTAWFSNLNIIRLENLQSANDILEEELKNSKNKVRCLEAEMKYFSKENALLNKEVKEMAYKMASSGLRGEKNAEKTSIDRTSPEAEIFYKNPNQQFDSFDSKSSAVADAKNSFPSGIIANNNASNTTGSHNEMLVLRRENEMNSLIRDFHEKFHTNNHSLHAQFQICQWLS